MGIYIDMVEMPTGHPLWIVVHSDGTVEANEVSTSRPVGWQTLRNAAIPVPPHGRLIDADKLHYNRIRIFYDDGTVGGYNAVVMSAEIKDAPAVDVRPVVRGKWKNAIQSCNDSPHVKCSVCGEYYWRYFSKFNFCPNCGADMREEA